MHPSALDGMAALLAPIEGEALTVLDVGSRDVNGTYRPLIEERGWLYTGLDVQAGANVDIVAADPFCYPLAADLFDVVISGSTMEHVTEIWRWIPELVRVLKPGGALAILTHWRFPEHRYPVDCWRIMPDGMAYLFDMTGCLKEYEIVTNAAGDIAARARKEGRYES